MTTERTWKIRAIDRSNPRTVTLAQYRAEIDTAKVRALAIFRASVAAQAAPVLTLSPNDLAAIDHAQARHGHAGIFDRHCDQCIEDGS